MYAQNIPKKRYFYGGKWLPKIIFRIFIPEIKLQKCFVSIMNVLKSLRGASLQLFFCNVTDLFSTFSTLQKVVKQKAVEVGTLASNFPVIYGIYVYFFIAK